MSTRVSSSEFHALMLRVVVIVSPSEWTMQCLGPGQSAGVCQLNLENIFGKVTQAMEDLVHLGKLQV